MSWGSRGSPHPKYFCMPARAGTSQLLSPCIPGGVPLLGAPCILISLWRASPSQTASAPAQTQKNSLARCKLPLGPGWITGLELGIPARVTPCSQRCWASTVLQPCCGAGRCPPHLHPLAKETRRKETPLKLLEGGDGGSAWLGSCRGRGQAQHFCIAPCSSPQGLGQRQGAVAVLLRSRMALAVTDDMLQNHLKIDSRRASLKAYYLH